MKGVPRCGGIFDLENREKAVSEFERESGMPGFWNDQNAAKEAISRANVHRLVLNPFNNLCEAIEEAQVLLELAEENADDEQSGKALEESVAAVEKAEKLFDKLQFQSLLSGELDGNNAYVSLHAGAGGTESCDWVDMLLRMYRRYCENHEFEFEMIELQPGDEAGVKRATFMMSGSFAYGYAKCERGVHRLVRISPFDSNSRRHTSFAAVDVVAEISDDVDVEIDEKDLRVDTYRSSGAGGQHVNTTDSAVRITHIPTGITVACQAERSQHKNKAKAMKVLRSKVYEYMLDQKRKDMQKFYGAKGEIAWGSQIRSYVLQPYTMVKDHRTGVETSNVDRVLDGDIDRFIEGYLKKTVEDGAGKE